MVCKILLNVLHFIQSPVAVWSMVCSPTGNTISEINAKQIVEHCDDLQYIFTSQGVPKINDPTSTEGQVVEKYTALLYNFAKNGYD